MFKLVNFLHVDIDLIKSKCVLVRQMPGERTGLFLVNCLLPLEVLLVSQPQVFLKLPWLCKTQ